MPIIAGLVNGVPSALAAVGMLLIGGQEQCTVSVVGPHRVVTAAHCLCMLPDAHKCVLPLFTFNMTVKVGNKEYHIRQAKMHPQYRWTYTDTEKIQYADVARIDVKETIDEPPLSIARTRPATATGVTVGAGRTDRTDFASAGALMQADVSVESCPVDVPIVPASLYRCTTAADTAHLCFGDSGGPLLVDGQIAGFIAGGDSACAGTGFFTVAAPYRRWLLAQQH